MLFSQRLGYASSTFAKIYFRPIISQDTAVDELDYVELGLLCADVCRTLDQRTNGKKPDELSQSVYDAISLLTS